MKHSGDQNGAPSPHGSTLAGIKEVFRAVGLALSDLQAEQFRVYRHELLRWNRKVNLISRKDEARIVERHFVESAALSKLPVFEGGVSVLDIGTGAGFPGLPLKIVRRDIEILLLDSKRMKSLFLKALTAKLKLDRVRVLYERAEKAATATEYKEKFDVVVCRAIAELADVYSMAAPFLKKHGSLVAIKGSRLTAELARFQSAHSAPTEIYELSELSSITSLIPRVVILGRS